MKENELKLIIRKCIGCDKTFKVMETSNQKYHSKECYDVATDRDTSRDGLRIPTAAEAFYIVTGVRPENGKNFSVMKNVEAAIVDDIEKIRKQSTEN